MTINDKKYHFIINPIAGRGRTYKAIKHIRSLLNNSDINYQITITKAPKHATEIAKHAANNSDVIVAIGGDGTVNEVTNGLINSNSSLGVIPLGSGNDFAKMLYIPNGLQKAFDIIINNETKLIDIGKVVTRINNKQKSEVYDERYFFNGIGVGFDASVAFESSKIKSLRGLPLYITALFKALLKYKTPHLSIDIDGKAFLDKFFLVTIGNGKCSGGGFYLTPDAELCDNYFDICYVNKINLFQIFKIFPSVLKGLHGKFKEVNFLKAKNLIIDSKDKFYVHADGEIVGNHVNNVEITLIPNAIKVISG